MIKAVFFDVDGTLLSHKTRQVPDDTKQVLQKLREKGIKIFVSTGRHPVELSRLPVNDVVCKAQESVSSPVPMIDVYDGEQIYQVTSYVTEKEAFQLEADLPDGCKMARWSDGGVDVIPADSGKTRGMEYFCAYYDIKPEETMAFGDAENDMDMLRSAQIGVAMGNAHNCVKTIADFVTTDVDRAGIRYAIEHFHII
ncbi:MAG TPA: HAD hydrolase family protein [Candidatus Onthocola gallistercoris]|uniref:HAD hydrolase family protein n=1 Tax=Candidatus Onthocola gallistercoris TaxID=2840876 RepID=A0A9D1HED7_9FIRM|nr:HAD hydrolase family protein [Candidatus Onthocola gallistercoris]